MELSERDENRGITRVMVVGSPTCGSHLAHLGRVLETEGMLLVGCCLDPDDMRMKSLHYTEPQVAPGDLQTALIDLGLRDVPIESAPPASGSLEPLMPKMITLNPYPLTRAQRRKNARSTKKRK